MSKHLASSRRTSYKDSGPSYPGSNTQKFDWNSLLLGKKHVQITDREFTDGLEAPKNSLDCSPRFCEMPRWNGLKQDEIPFGYEISKSGGLPPVRKLTELTLHNKPVASVSEKVVEVPIKTLIAQDAMEEIDKRRRSSPSVVARLMGLDTVPDKLSKQHPKASKNKKVEKKSQDAKGNSSRPGTPVELRNGKDLPSPKYPQRNDQDYSDDQCQFEVLPFRSHPQEKQLQEFKKEFMAQLAHQRQERPERRQVEFFNKELEDRRMLLREKLKEAKAALAGDGQGSSRRLSSAQEKLIESQEFQDAIELLQTNREFFRKCFQESNLFLCTGPSISATEARVPPQYEESRVPSPYEESRWESRVSRSSFQSREADPIENASSERFSDQRRRRECRQKPLATKLSPPVEDGTIKARVAPLDRELSSRSTPDDGRHGSPSNFDSRKGSQSPSRIVVLKPGPGDSLLPSSIVVPNCSPRSYRVVRDGRGVVLEVKEKDRAVTQDWDCSRDETRVIRESPRDRVKESFRDPRDIARDIVREARSGVSREVSKELGQAGLTRVGSVVKRTPLSRLGVDSLDVTGSSEGDGSATLASLSRRSISEHQCRLSTTSPGPSRLRSQETASTSSSSKDAKRRGSERQKASAYDIEHCDDLEQLKPVVRRASTHVESCRSSLPRGRKGSPAFKYATNESADVYSDSHVPEVRKEVDDGKLECSIRHVERFADGDKINESSDDEGRECASIVLPKCRSVPNSTSSVATGRGRGGLQFKDGGGGGRAYERVSERVESVRRHGEARGIKLLTRKKVNTSEKSRPDLNNSTCSTWSPLHAKLIPQVNEEVSVPVDVRTGSYRKMDRSAMPVATSSPQSRNSSENVDRIKESARQSARACEKDLLQALSLLSPHTHAGKDQLGSASQKLEALLAPTETQLSRSKPWSIATDALDSADVDGASETSVDKCGQPSPVSVLDSPFEAEIPSPVEFKEITSDLQELRLRLRLLKFDGSERSKAFLESIKGRETLCEHDFVRHTENCLQSAAFNTSGATCKEHVLKESQPFVQNQDSLQHFRVAEPRCSVGRANDLLYVRNLLIASGLSGSSTDIITRWYAPNCPLDLRLFEQIEEQLYSFTVLPKNSSSIARSPKNMHGFQDSCNRKLLFDVVNEVLMKLLSPYLNYHPWVQPGSPILRPVPLNQELFRQTWEEISHCFPREDLESCDAIESFLERDLPRGVAWIECREVVEEIGLDLEQSILSSLIEETILAFFPRNCTTSSYS